MTRILVSMVAHVTPEGVAAPFVREQHAMTLDVLQPFALSTVTAVLAGIPSASHVQPVVLALMGLIVRVLYSHVRGEAETGHSVHACLVSREHIARFRQETAGYVTPVHVCSARPASRAKGHCASKKPVTTWLAKARLPSLIHFALTDGIVSVPSVLLVDKQSLVMIAPVWLVYARGKWLSVYRTSKDNRQRFGHQPSS